MSINGEAAAHNASAFARRTLLMRPPELAAPDVISKMKKSIL